MKYIIRIRINRKWHSFEIAFFDHSEISILLSGLDCEIVEDIEIGKVNEWEEGKER